MLCCNDCKKIRHIDRKQDFLKNIAALQKCASTRGCKFSRDRCHVNVEKLRVATEMAVHYAIDRLRKPSDPSHSIKHYKIKMRDKNIPSHA